MFSYQILNHPESFTIDETRVDEIFQTMSTNVDIVQEGSLNIAFLSDDEIESLNREYRGIDKTTDVLSFHYFDDFSQLWDDEVAGECIFSESRILSQAEEHGHSPREEFEILLIHSILHILWYDHESDEEYEEMKEVEDIIRRIIIDKI